ncbi:GNAT superfamily N-acetyltransferase [Actinoplanes lutulentus]|uniref:L-amino acid N-acyltransferase YncA n=1 Tax=Actinoplanes lutulentus TaxID=1287878 RepID=A0A327Z9B1_9ACTN|nr:GNAT family N-acetyltransferase [Actinoplanes lutulentus]MBB2942430.1 GNAT superfamily N-acetyltransferase [Actinoplanes lutulentus]RAK33200.1 L-amino acid N-acyltransferase YncA [Actinoplanes lutulentus]
MALWRIRATVDDRPGYLSVLTASLALRSVNILAVQVHTTEEGAVDDFLVDAPDALTDADVLAAVVKGRGRDVFVTRAEAQGLADQPTRALALAGRLVHEPDALGETLVALLDATEVRWRPGTVTEQPGFHGGRMTLADPAGGSYEVLRALPAFTPAEYARAQALVELAGVVVRQQHEQVTLLLSDGAELVVRPATKDDLAAVRELHESCSQATLRRRYLSGSVPGDNRLRQLLEPAGGVTLVAATPAGAVIAMANLVTEGDLGEVALLVEDGWQRRGLGTALLRRLYGYAERSGFAAVVAHTGADNVAMLRTLRRLGAGSIERDGTMVSVTLPTAGSPVGKETPATSG